MSATTVKTPVSIEDCNVSKATFEANNARREMILVEIENLEQQIQSLKEERNDLYEANGDLKGLFSPLQAGSYYFVTETIFVGKTTVIQCYVKCLTTDVFIETITHDLGVTTNHIWGTGEVVKVVPHSWGVQRFEVGQIIDLYRLCVDQNPLVMETKEVFRPQD